MIKFILVNNSHKWYRVLQNDGVVMLLKSENNILRS